MSSNNVSYSRLVPEALSPLCSLDSGFWRPILKYASKLLIDIADILGSDTYFVAPIAIMPDPLPFTDSEGVILGDLQIVHRLHARDKHVAGDRAHASIASQDVHADLDLAHW